MTDSNATELLREMLDERGVEYEVDESDNTTYFCFDWCDECGSYLKHIFVTGSCIEASIGYLTPEQAVAATLGSGECDLVETGVEHIEADVHMLECSKCGRTCEHVFGDYDYCPYCGRTVKR